MNKRKRKKWLKQHNLYVNPRDTWNLDTKIAEFVLPRLKLFKDMENGYPGHGEMDTPEKWNEAFDKMINAFELLVKSGEYYGVWDYPRQTYLEVKPLLEQKQKEVDEGLQLFAKWFQSLWW